MKQHFKQMLEYNDWANKATAASISETINIDEKAIFIFAHIAASQKIWLNRILGKEIIRPWEKLTLDESIILSSQSNKEWLGYIINLMENDFDVIVKYVNSKGEEFNNSIKQILNHVLNHSTYHRGQVASIVRQSGGKPALTDYIIHVR
jgi:uncharacterized damage-inducible protein DinB